MKKYFLLLAVAFTGVVTTAISQTKNGLVTNYNVDTIKSTFQWHATKILGAHDGDIKCNQGQINFKDTVLSDAYIIIDMTTINNTDLSGNSRDALVRHLKSEDFFDVEKYKTSELRVKKVKIIRPTAKYPYNYEITAEITIKGISKEIKFPAMIEYLNNYITVTAKLEIDRTDFGIKYASKKFFKKIADGAINDKFSISVNIIAVNN
jgi:polyisoprenoid-binding protein YceI